MVTADVVQGAFRAIVEAHIAGLNFYSVWTAAKDEESTTLFPCCLWAATQTQVFALDSQALRPAFVLDCLFVEQTASDRTSAERDAAHSKMDAVARQIWARFYQTYVTASNTFNGIPLDFDPKQVGQATFMPVWDDRTMQMTGVRFSVRIVSGAPEQCQDIYFNA